MVLFLLIPGIGSLNLPHDYLGAVAGVSNVTNPIKLARMVMEKTDHCLLVGEGAQQFAQECGVETVDPSALVTAACKAEWEQYQRYKVAVDSLFNNK